MKTLVLIVPATLVFFTFAACSAGENQETASPPLVASSPVFHPEEPTLAAEPPEVTPTVRPAPEPSPTPVTNLWDCPPAAKPIEQQLREVLISSGPLIGETVTLQLDGCDLVGTFTFEKVNEYQRTNPTADPSSYPMNPKRELRIWEAQHGLPQDSTKQMYIEWQVGDNVTREVCAVLEAELRCYD